MMCQYARFVTVLFLLTTGVVNAQGQDWEDVNSLVTAYFDMSEYSGLAMATLKDGSKTNYGLGWDVSTDDAGSRSIGHPGSSVGGSSMMLSYPDIDLVMVTLINQSEARARELVFMITGLIRNR